MLFTIAYAYLTITTQHRARRKSQKRSMILESVRKTIWKSSVVFRRAQSIVTLGSPGLINLNFIPQKSGIRRTQVELYADNCTVTASLTPQVVVDLGDWTSYLKADRQRQAEGEVSVVLEVHSPEGSTEPFDAPSDENSVHVLDHGKPIAWKSGKEFGILIRSSVENFVTLGLALCEGCLRVEDNFIVKSILSVSTVGQPSKLIEESDQVELQNSEESPRSDMTEKVGSQLRSNMKPPNVLLYCGKKEPERVFENLNSLMQKCLNTESYTIYSLKHDTVHTTPWIENTALLVISSECLCDDVDTKFIEYFRKGGHVISFRSSFDNYLVEKAESGSASKLIEMQFRKKEMLNTMVGRYYYLIDQPKSADLQATVLAEDTSSGKAAIVSVQKMGEPQSGIAILSQAYLDVDPPAITDEESRAVGKDADARRDILMQICALLQMDCTQHQAPPMLTPCLLLANQQKLKQDLMHSIQYKLKDGRLASKLVSLDFVESLADIKEEITPEILPVVIGNKISDQQIKYFDLQNYWKNLKSKVLGQVLMYADVVPTTQTLMDGLIFLVPNSVGLIAVAGRQTKGTGRGGNAWLSPLGCAMFTLHARISLDSALGQRLPFLQHIVSTAVVESVRTMPGYEDINLRLKWPNDIYHGSAIKIGGVLVNATTMGDTVHAIIGCGFNVDNSTPTVCINDLIRKHNMEHGTELSPCSIGQLLGRTVTTLERLIDEFQSKGHQHFCDLYYQRWLHSWGTLFACGHIYTRLLRQTMDESADSIFTCLTALSSKNAFEPRGAKVTLENEDGLDVEITGLDDYGFLSVRSKDGTQISVQPDGNSFDMMQNLIASKTR